MCNGTVYSVMFKFPTHGEYSKLTVKHAKYTLCGQCKIAPLKPDCHVSLKILHNHYFASFWITNFQKKLQFTIKRTS